MPLSTFTGIQPYLIAERSEATPGLFNNLVSVVSQNLDQLNADTLSLSAAAPPGALNAASLPGSGVSQIQAAINKAAALAIPVVYLPTNLLPYDASQISFIYTVQMVREGGDWSVYDVRAYGAGGLTTDDTIAFRSAFSGAQASVGSNRVWVPPGKYGISSTLSIPPFVSLEGVGRGSLLSAIGPVRPMLGVGTDGLAGFGNRYGACEGLFLNGGSAGSIGLRVDLAVSRTFRRISIESFRECGLVVNGTQNCLFDSMDIEFNGVGNSVATSAGMRLNHGAGNNVFIRCEIDQNAPVGLLFIQDDSADTIVNAGFNQPEANLFLGCILERPASSTSTMLVIRDGRFNKFTGCNFSNTSLPYTVQLANPPSAANAQNSFDHCFFAGHSAATLALVGSAAFGTRFEGCFSENHLAVIESANRVFTDGMNFWSTSGASYTNTGGNAVFNNLGPQLTGALNLGGNFVSGLSGGRVIWPALQFSDESALGLYRSGASAIGFSYGQLQMPDGSALQPPFAFSSESSLGWFRSAASTMALSYGTLTASLYSSTGVSGIDIYAKDQNAYRTGVASGFYFMDVGIMIVRGGNAATSGGQLRVGADGSASVPSIHFSNEVGLGWYRSAASVLALSRGGLGIKAGTDASCGTATLGSNGSVNVATKYVAANDLIFLTDQTPGGTIGDLEVGGIRAGSGFTILSTSITDTSTVAWLIVRPT